MIEERETIKTLEQKLIYLFLTRDKKVFEEQLSLLTNLKSEIIETKSEFISQQNENEANKWLSIENICLSIIEGLNLFVKLKENDPDAAWNNLIAAQNHSHWSNNEYQLSGTIQRDCISHFNNIELVLFPPQSFMSISMVSEKSECSICHKEFSECDHIRGEAYMGKACTEIATKIRDMHHVALVDHPDDKRCRVTHYGDKDPPTINKMTLLDESIDRQDSESINSSD